VYLPSKWTNEILSLECRELSSSIILDSCHSTAEVDHRCVLRTGSQDRSSTCSPFRSPCLVAVTLQSNTSGCAIQHRIVHAMERSLSAQELSVPPGQSLRAPSPIEQHRRPAQRRVSSADLDNLSILRQLYKNGLRDAMRSATTPRIDPARDEAVALEAQKNQTSMEGQQTHRKLAYQHPTFSPRP
jgi:hypothetical protein